MNFVQKCMDIWADPYKEVTYWKDKRGFKVVGWSMMYAPEELIHAAGCMPVYLHGRHTTVTKANKQLQSYFCPPSRLMVNSALSNDFDFADAILFISTCDEIEHIAHIIDIKLEKQPIWLFRIPFAIYQPICQDKLRVEIEKIKSALEDLSGNKITSEKLSNSIKIFNETRALQRKLYDLRARTLGILSNIEMQAVIGASMFMPKDVYNEQLEGLLNELQDKEGVKYRVKVVIAGSICDDPGHEVMQGLEDVGIAVAYDDMFIGSHYFQSDVDEEEEPFEAITKIYWEGNPTPCKLQKEKRNYAENIVNIVRETGSHGIINYEWKFCEYQTYARPYVKEVFEKAGIPFLKIDIAEETMAKEAIKTRYEAFVEILERRDK